MSSKSFPTKNSNKSTEQQIQKTVQHKNTKYQQTSHKFIPRYNGPDPSQMTPAQTKIHQSIIKSRPRTGISGPFGPWLSIPSIADPAQQLGRACRYGTSLSFRESELVILLTGARHTSHSEFDIHVGEALKAGISMSLIESIPRDEEFSTKAVEDRVVPLLQQSEKSIDDRHTQQSESINIDCAREIAIVRFVSELLETSTVSDERYSEAKITLGDDSVLVEITSIVGYYTYCAYTLNVFQIPTKASNTSGTHTDIIGDKEEEE